MTDITPSASSSKYVLLKVSDHKRQPDQLDRQPVDGSRLSVIRPIYEDRSNIASSSKSGKDPREHDKTGIPDITTGHNMAYTQFPPLTLNASFAAPRMDHTWDTDHGGSTEAIPDPEVFENMGHPRRTGPVRGLYRHHQPHHDQLVQEQIPQQPSGKQAYGSTCENINNDWPINVVDWPTSNTDLFKAMPSTNTGARQLAALNPGHRGDVIISNGNSKTALSRSVSQLTAMDTEKASREWHLQRQSSGSIADANTEFGFRSGVADGDVQDERFGFSFSTSIYISPDPRDRELSPMAGRRSSSFLSSHDFNHTVQRRQADPSTTTKSTRSSSFPVIPTGSDILRAAVANLEIDQTPMAFRAYLRQHTFSGESPSPEHEQCGRTVSASLSPASLRQYVKRGKGEHQLEHEHEDDDEDIRRVEAASLATPASPPSTSARARVSTPVYDESTTATDRILHLVRTLENQRDELVQKNHALLVAIERANVSLQGAEAAYDDAERTSAARIEELELEAGRLEEENAVLRGRG